MQFLAFSFQLLVICGGGPTPPYHLLPDAFPAAAERLVERDEIAADAAAADDEFLSREESERWASRTLLKSEAVLVQVLEMRMAARAYRFDFGERVVAVLS